MSAEHVGHTVEINRPLPPDTYPPIVAEHKGMSALATGVGGVVGGAIIGAGIVASKKLNQIEDSSETKE